MAVNRETFELFFDVFASFVLLETPFVLIKNKV